MKISSELENRARLLLTQNRKIEAIKVIIDGSDMGLKEAKEYVDLLAEIDIPINTDQPEKLNEQLINLLTANRKLEAIKLYKDRTGLGLAESKDYIENLQLNGQNLISQPNNLTRNTSIENILANQNINQSKPFNAIIILVVIILIALFTAVFFYIKA